MRLARLLVSPGTLLSSCSVVLLLVAAAAADTPNRVTILYDSFGKNPALTMDWGFAALVEYGGKRIPVRYREQCANLRT